MKTIWMALLKPRTWVAKLCLLLLIVILLIFNFLDYLEPIKTFLNSDMLSFQVGHIRFSVYLLIKTIMIIMTFLWLASVIYEFIETYIKKVKVIKNSNQIIIAKVLQIFIYFLAFVLAFNVMGIDLTTLAIFSGAVGIGIGVGLQKITANFLSGFILLFERSVKSDDLVELSDGTYGFIRSIKARYTLIETFEGKEIMIPNEDFVTHHVANWTHSNNKARVAIKIGVSYESDIEKVERLILEAAKEHPRCIDNPKPSCFLREFADSSVNFLLLFWVADVKDGRYGPTSDVLFAIWKKFKANHIAIPYPQRDLYIKNLKDFK